jgi:uncharacterized protein YkwD
VTPLPFRLEPNALRVLFLFFLLVACGPAPTGPEVLGSGCDPTYFDLTSELTSGPAEAVLQLNCYRKRMEANIVSLDPSLSEAAQMHAEYLAATGAWGHGETDTSQPSFRGQTPVERAEAAGYSVDENLLSVTELIGFRASGADASKAVDLWFDTVYHRLPLAIPELEAVGFGSSGIYDVMLVVSPWEAPQEAPEFLSNAYPVAGQTAVPLLFDTDNEVPDPMPDQQDVGFPISLSFLDGSFHTPSDLYDLVVDEEKTELRDFDGTPVPSRLLTPANDELVLRSIVLIPLEPLRPQHTYTTVFAGELDGSPFSQVWSFQTQLEENN